MSKRKCTHPSRYSVEPFECDTCYEPLEGYGEPTLPKIKTIGDPMRIEPPEDQYFKPYTIQRAWESKVKCFGTVPLYVINIGWWDDPYDPSDRFVQVSRTDNPGMNPRRFPKYVLERAEKIELQWTNDDYWSACVAGRRNP